jgi:hypothetical protein
MALGRIYHRRTAKKGKSMSDKKNTNKYMYQSGGEPMTLDEYTKRLGQITNSFTYSLGNRNIAVTAGQINFDASPGNIAVLKSLYNCLASYTFSLKDNVPNLKYDVMRTNIETAISTVKGAVDLDSGTVRVDIEGADTTPINKKLKSAADAAAAATKP